MTRFEQDMIGYLRSMQLLQAKLGTIYFDLKTQFPDTLAIQLAVLNLQEVVLHDFEAALAYYEHHLTDLVTKNDFPELKNMLSDFDIGLS